MENHVESCHCWHCGGYGKVSYIRDGDVEDWGHCHDCDGGGELYRAKITQTTVIRAFLTQAKHALEDIDLMDSDLDQIYTKIDQVVADVENYEKKVGTRDDATDVVSRSNRPENLGECSRHYRRR